MRKVMSTMPVKLLLNLLLVTISSSFALAKGPDYRNYDVQSPEPAWIDDTYFPTNPQSFPDVALTEPCKQRLPHPAHSCVYSPDFDLALEQEYWKHISLQEPVAMENWLKKKDLYVWNSKTPNAGRFEILSIFGNLMIYSAQPKIYNLLKSPFVAKSYQSADRALNLLPRSPNAQAFYWALRNFTDFALGLIEPGLSAADKMIALSKNYGVHGLAGPVGAAAHLMGSNDPKIVLSGIQLFDRCLRDQICNHETSIAPFQILGTRIAQAEAYAFLNDIKKMDESFDEARKLARKRHWPLATRLPEIRLDLIRKGGLMDQWKVQKQVAGGLRFPLGAAHRIEACSMCHIGNTVPLNYQIANENH